jgi:hypothetical protein
MVHQTQARFFLHDLGYERDPIYSLAAAKIMERRLATRRRLERSSTVAGAVSSGAPAPRFAPEAEVQAGPPPPSVELAQDASARWIDGDGGLLGGGDSVSGQIRT